MTATANIKSNTNSWLGNYPNHWKSIPVWALFNDNSVKNEDLIENNVLSLSYGKIIRRDVESNMGLLPESFDTYQIVNTGNIVLRLTDLQNDKRSLRVGLVNEKGIITSAYTGLVLKYPDCVPEYFYYSLHRLDIMKYFYSLGGGVRQSVGYRELKWLKLPVPPIEEQNQIVEYIKKQSEKINRFIAKKQRFIELLKEQKQGVINETVTKGIDKNVKLKETGYQFCSQIPEKYLIEKFNNYVSIKHGFQFRDGDFTEEGIKIVKISQLNPNGYLDLSNADTISSKRLKEFEDIIIKDGDILMALTGGTIGKLIIADTNGEILLQNYRVGNFTINNEEVLFKDYLYLQLSSPFIQAQINFYVRETGQPNIGKGDFRKLKIIIPPLEEQKQIVLYIKTETATIDKAIAKTEREIELIKEYKEAMIAEAVMGKAKIYNTVNAK